MASEVHVAIIGGGPAGSTCASMLAGAGRRVSLFESRPVSEKPCGGGVPAAGVRDFPELLDGGLQRRIVREVVIYSPANRRATVPLSEGIHVFKRLEMDSFLRSRAAVRGAELHETRVRSVRRIAGRWELETEKGRMGPFDRLIGADGVRGIVRRSVLGEDSRSAPFTDSELTLGLYAYVQGVTRGEMVLKFLSGIDGYLWVFPRTDHVSVGICATHRSATPSRLEEELHRFVDEHYPEGRLSKGGLKGYFIPSSRHHPSARAGSTWALIGDAGGFVDPLTREGIAHAMRSARALAARMIARDEIRTPVVSGDLLWAHRHKTGFFRPEFLENMTRLANASGAIRRVLADLLQGQQSYRWLRPRLLLNAVPCGVQVGRRLLNGSR